MTQLYLKWADHFCAASITCEWERFVTPAAAIANPEGLPHSQVGEVLIEHDGKQQSCWLSFARVMTLQAMSSKA